MSGEDPVILFLVWPSIVNGGIVLGIEDVLFYDEIAGRIKDLVVT